MTVMGMTQGTGIINTYGFMSMITGTTTLFTSTVYCDYAMIYIHYVLEMISNIKYKVTNQQSEDWYSYQEPDSSYICSYNELPNLQKNVYQAFNSAYYSIRVEFAMGWPNWDKWTIEELLTGVDWTMDDYAQTDYDNAFENIFPSLSVNREAVDVLDPHTMADASIDCNYMMSYLKVLQI